MTHIKDEEDDFCLIRVIDILTNQIIKIKIVDISNLYFIQIGLNKHRKYVNGKVERQNVAYIAPSTPHKRSHIYNWPGCWSSYHGGWQALHEHIGPPPPSTSSPLVSTYK